MEPTLRKTESSKGEDEITSRCYNSASLHEPDLHWTFKFWELINPFFT